MSMPSISSPSALAVARVASELCPMSEIRHENHLNELNVYNVRHLVVLRREQEILLMIRRSRLRRLSRARLLWSSFLRRGQMKRIVRYPVY